MPDSGQMENPIKSLAGAKDLIGFSLFPSCFEVYKFTNILQMRQALNKIKFTRRTTSAKDCYFLAGSYMYLACV